MMLDHTDIPASLQSSFPPVSRPPVDSRPLHIVLATTGSVASIKTGLIVETLLHFANVRIQVISSDASLHFYDPDRITQSCQEKGLLRMTPSYTVASLASENANARDTNLNLHFWHDRDEWNGWRQVGDPILHIELRRWADVVLVAPCSANTLAKLHAGICDDLLTSMLRALSRQTPTYIFPAMNTLMYLHPLTSTHLDFVRDVLGYKVIGPIAKKLACGDLGQGAMQEWTDIVDLLVQQFNLTKSVVQAP